MDAEGVPLVGSVIDGKEVMVLSFGVEAGGLELVQPTITVIKTGSNRLLGITGS
jgi:hypothetical protein